jgi:predicted amidophosphoribosyltransferase
MSRLALADALGRRLGAEVLSRVSTTTGETFSQGDLPNRVTFVPSHISRQMTRGGTSARVIAQGVACVLNTPCEGLIRLTRRIKKQAWLDDTQRIQNVRNAFLPRRQLWMSRRLSLSNEHIMLVDDVLTTGATANEIARVLKQLGARKVTLAVIARTIRGS